MIKGKKEFNHFLMDSCRIRGIATTLISIEKNEVKPQTLSDGYHEKFNGSALVKEGDYQLDLLHYGVKN